MTPTKYDPDRVIKPGTDNDDYALELVQEGISVLVRIVDSTGTPVLCGYLISISVDGTLARHYAVDERVAERAGIQLENQRIVAE